MFNFDKRYIYIVLIFVFLYFVVSSITAGTMSIENLILFIPAILIAITFHEFAHAWVATKLGDDTPRLQGRLTLNPLKHLDPIGTILLFTVGMGWGKPVTINPTRFNRKISMKKGQALVALAGPLMNMILALIFTIILGITLRVANLNMMGLDMILSGYGDANFFLEGLILFLYQTIFINIGLGVFNLLPLPPLDGSKILISVLPDKASNWVITHETLFSLIFVVLWITNLASYIITPAINAISLGMLRLMSFIIKI